MTRVSFFVHDLASNPIVRAAPLALALSDDFEVEVLGFLHAGDHVYEPYRHQFVYRTLACSRDVTAVAARLPELARMATGDIIYACKPLVTSLGPALIASRCGRRRPLLLDVEDDEWIPMGRTWGEFLARDVVRGWRHATAWKYTRALHPFVACAGAVTVSSRQLQRRYGGTLVRHGPDERVFDPAAVAPQWQARASFGLPATAPLALFAGVPQPHKGLQLLRDALQIPRASMWHLVLAGPRHGEFDACMRALPGRCHHVGLVAQSQMPALLAAVDAVPVPQLATPFAQSQLPAKALEAMTMGRAVVASAVADLPDILGDDRGWVVPPGDVAALAAALEAMAVDPDARARRGAAARAWCLDEATRGATRRRLVPIVSALCRSRGRSAD